MILGDQKAVVRKIGALAATRSREAAGHRQVIQTWKREHIATPGTLVWFFAAGAMWCAGKSKGNKDGARLSRLAIGAANTSLLVWRFVKDTSIESSAAFTASAGEGQNEANTTLHRRTEDKDR